MPTLPGDPDKMEAQLRAMGADFTRQDAVSLIKGPHLEPVEVKKSRPVKKRDLVDEGFIPPGTWIIPVATYSVANSRDIKASIGRKGKQQDVLFRVMCKYHNVLAGYADVAIHQKNQQVRVTFTRIGPGTLDEDDNLPMSMKSLKDGVARLLAVDDKDKLHVCWVYEQEKSDKIGVKVQLEIV